MATIEKLTHVSEINQLVSQGKEKGYLTYEEVNDVLPSDVVTPEQIDDLMALFSENEIAIVDTSTKGEKIAASKGDKKDSNEDDAVAPKSDSVSIDDPVRLYLREMGTISLLTRKGDVEIAKRIEAGQHEVLGATASSSLLSFLSPFDAAIFSPFVEVSTMAISFSLKRAIRSSICSGVTTSEGRTSLTSSYVR